MRVGSLVMFKDEGHYAKWFGGQLGLVASMKNGHVRVHWLKPVKYYDRRTSMSDFEANKFEVINESR